MRMFIISLWSTLGFHSLIFPFSLVSSLAAFVTYPLIFYLQKWTKAHFFSLSPALFVRADMHLFKLAASVEPGFTLAQRVKETLVGTGAGEYTVQKKTCTQHRWFIILGLNIPSSLAYQLKATIQKVSSKRDGLEEVLCPTLSLSQ